MSTRSSARIKNKPNPVNYDDEENDTENEDISNIQKKPVKKTRGRQPSKKTAVSKKKNKADKSLTKDVDDDDDDDDVKPTKKATTRGRPKKTITVKSQSPVRSDNDDVKPPKQTRGKRKQPSKISIPEDKEIITKKSKIEAKLETKVKEEKGKTIAVPVDTHCHQRVNDSQVFVDESGPWDAMLNQTNIGGNNNKYYLIQLLKSSSGTYYTWFRWGRIGYVTASNTSLKPFHSLDAAMKAFKTKFHDKTKNRWDERGEFEKYNGKYDYIKLDYSTKDNEVEVDGGVEVKAEPVESKLDPRVLSLIELISNVKTMESAVMSMDYDVKKSPLGKLSKEQIKSGYEALKIIEDCIKADVANGRKSTDACSLFYTRIPHAFGFSVPPKIVTLEQVKLKLDLLDTLMDIEAAISIIREGVNDKTHKADSFYKNLQLEMKPLEKDGEMFKMLTQYLHNTHGATHAHYSLEVEDIFELRKEGDEERFVDHGNRQLLWHGSRLTNWGGIFSQGLRIAPPEAPVTGYMFGKGVYFADMASKSANYCFTSRSNPTGILLLADVSLGDERELLSSDFYADKLPAGKHSTKGLGKTAPNPADTKVVDGVKIPMGKGTKTGISNPGGYTLEYNEFIVYDVKQIKMKYAMKVRFNYKR